VSIGSFARAASAARGKRTNADGAGRKGVASGA
jgi:hypothetical protein